MTHDDAPPGWRRYRCKCGYRWETPTTFPDDDPQCRRCGLPAVAVSERIEAEPR